MVWLWQFYWQLLWIFSELGIDVVVVQQQLIFQWNWQWHCCHWYGTVFFSGMWICGVIGSTLIFCRVWFYTLGTRVVNCYTLRNWLPWCGRLVYGDCTTHLKFSNSFWWQLVQVIQVLMVMTVLGFQGHILIVMLQLLLHMLMMFWACKNGEERSQLCLKFSRLWCL